MIANDIDIVNNERTSKPNRARRRISSRVVAAERFQHLCYYGVGKVYLGHRLAEYTLGDDGSWKLIRDESSVRWKWDNRRVHKYDRYKEVREHLNGKLRGICRDVGETHVPFIKLDGDRHDPSISVEDHLRTAAKMHTIARRYSYLSWLVEVNPENGSFGYFGFWDKKPIPAQIAKKLGNKIKQELEAVGVKAEVFPSSNSPQVRLPFRPDKFCLLGDQKTNDLTKFWDWNGKLSPWSFVRNEIRAACSNMPYVPEAPEPVEETVSQPLPRLNTNRTIDDLRSEPNAYTRQLTFALILARTVRRVPTVTELEEAIREQKLYSAPWHNPARRERLRSIVKHIRKTFDPAKLPKKRSSLEPIQPSRFGRRIVLRRVRELPLFSMRNFDPETMTCSAELVRIRKSFLRKVADMTYHFLVVQPEANEGVSTKRFKASWKSYLPKIKWDERQFRAIRDWLDREGLIDIYDRQHCPTKCWRWRLGEKAKGVAVSAFAVVLDGICDVLCPGRTKDETTQHKLNYLCPAAKSDCQNRHRFEPDKPAFTDSS